MLYPEYFYGDFNSFLKEAIHRSEGFLLSDEKIRQTWQEIGRTGTAPDPVVISMGSNALQCKIVNPH